ncbi:MAG TPA: DNRLRE domain-containing protein [Bacteroidia bacterium]|nr:DNRLRE domain-containing protein [Bacteroidia bacterium]
MKKILCFCFFLSSFFAGAQTLVTFTLDSTGEDATVNSWPWEPNNAGTIPIYQSAGYTGPMGFFISRSFFKFDLISIPFSSIVLNAKLSLYFPDSTIYTGGNWSIGNSNESVLQRVISSWSENTITWSNQPTATIADQVILPESTSPYQDYPNIDVTAMVQQMISNPSMNFGFFLHLTIESYHSQLLFASGDNLDSTKHPKLEVTYMPVGIEENYFSNAINIFPNPATTEVTINFSKAARCTVQLCNTLGEVLEHRALTPNPSPSGEGSASIDVSKVVPGIYFITITDEAGNKMVRKVVKM